MTDELREALDRCLVVSEAKKARNKFPHALIMGPTVDDVGVVVEAARAHLDCQGETIWWCKNHESSPCAPHEASVEHCFLGHAMNGMDTCRMVEAVLTVKAPAQDNIVGSVIEDIDRQYPRPRLVCTVCGLEAIGDWGSLRTGWRKCCGYTMRLITGREAAEARPEGTE